MAYHSVSFTNPQFKKLLFGAGINPEDFILQVVKGKPARTKGKVKVEGNKVTVFGSDFVAK